MSSYKPYGKCTAMCSYKAYNKHNSTQCMCCHRNDVNKVCCPIPQLDGNSDALGSNSDDDFKTKRKKKRKRCTRTRKRLSFVSDYENTATSTAGEKEIQHRDFDSHDLGKGQPERTKQAIAKDKHHSSTALHAIEEFDDLSKQSCLCDNKGDSSTRKKRTKVEKSSNKKNSKNNHIHTQRYNLKPFKIVIDDIVNKEILNSKCEKFTSVNVYEKRNLECEDGVYNNDLKYDLNVNQSTDTDEYEFHSNNTLYHDVLHTLSIPSPYKETYDDGNLPCYSQTLLLTNIDTHTPDVDNLSTRQVENINITPMELNTSKSDKLAVGGESIVYTTVSSFHDNAMSSINTSKLNVIKCQELIPIEDSDVNILFDTNDDNLSSNGSDIPLNAVTSTIVNVDEGRITTENLPLLVDDDPSHSVNYCQQKNSHVDKEARNENLIILTPELEPPTRESVLESLVKYDLCEVSNIQAFYGNEEGLGTKTG